MTDDSSLRNWAGNLRYSTNRLHAPTTVGELQEVVASCAKVKVLGSRHSFNEIADSTENLLSLSAFPERQSLFLQIGEVDRERQRVTVGGGVRYGDLSEALHRQGYALHNLASLPHISVAGACATATHGSGDSNGNLASAVVGIQFVRADGSVRSLDRDRLEDRAEFAGAVVNLGALGVVTELTLAVVPTYWVRQDLYENVPLTLLDTHFDALFGDAYSVSLFTDWKEPVFTQAWRKSQVEMMEAQVLTQDVTEDPHMVVYREGADWFGTYPVATALHPIPDNDAKVCTAQGTAGPWYRRLPHFRMEFTPSNGSELQSEYLVPRPHILEALHAVAELRERIAPLLLTSEIRTIAADDLWMSPCYQQPCVAIHFTWQQDWPGVSALLPDIEGRLAPLGARPHWGKLFLMSGSQLEPLYPRWHDFVRLMNQCDPTGKFRNAFLEKIFFNY